MLTPSEQDPEPPEPEPPAGRDAAPEPAQPARDAAFPVPFEMNPEMLPEMEGAEKI